jgi:hypothetical protein
MSVYAQDGECDLSSNEYQGEHVLYLMAYPILPGFYRQYVKIPFNHVVGLHLSVLRFSALALLPKKITYSVLNSLACRNDEMKYL